MNQDVPWSVPAPFHAKRARGDSLMVFIQGTVWRTQSTWCQCATSPPFHLPLTTPTIMISQLKLRQSPERPLNGGTTHRQPNGYMTPTAENPEYLGLAETWSGQMEYTWGSIRYSLSASVSGDVCEVVCERVSEWVSKTRILWRTFSVGMVSHAQLCSILYWSWNLKMDTFPVFAKKSAIWQKHGTLFFF